MSEIHLTREFIKQSIFRINENTPRIEKCLNQLSEDEIWKRPNDSLSSIGNLILHLCGNITQYIVSSLGEQEDDRKREKEFSIESGYTKKDLLEILTQTVNKAIEVIHSLNEKDLLNIKQVQCFKLSGVGIIIHVVEHYSYHTGQIAYWTKILKNKDLEFYGNMNLNKRNIN